MMVPRFSKYLPDASAIAAMALAAALFGTSMFAPAPAKAQYRNSGSVTVDLSVLDQYGQPQNIPQLVQPSVRSLLMPNARPARGLRSNQLNRPLTRPGASADSNVRLKRPKKQTTRRAATPRRAAAPRTTPRPLSRTAPRKPAAPRTTPPPPPKIAAVPTPAPKAPSMAPKAPTAPSVARIPSPPPPPPPVAKTPAAPRAVTKAPPPAPAVPAPPPMASTAPPPPAPSPPKAAPQTASIPPAPAKSGSLTPGQQFRIGFGAGTASIDKQQGTELDRISRALKQEPALRLQVLAYAGGASQTPSQARRLSLSRALAVRSRLIEQGVRSTRIDVRALGNKSEGGPPDRVDVIITQR